MDAKNENKCQIFGCFRDKKPEATVTVEIKEEEQTFEVCNFHQEMFQTWPTSFYKVGETYHGELEVRFQAANPSQQTDAPAPEEE